MKEVSLQEILDAREARAALQAEYRKQYSRPLLSFTMNIPGPVKDSPLIRRGFNLGLRLLDHALAEANMTILAQKEKRAITGCELLCAVDAPAEEIKALCVKIEEESPLGRLFDMDVLTADGSKLEREAERRCIVCGATGRGCASRRVHTLEELSGAVNRLLVQGLLDADAEEIARLAAQALLDELNTTPKPGLVDLNNNGSHSDMTAATFRRSIDALRDYWPDCFRIGVGTAGRPPEEAFAELRSLGLEAEKTMFAATGGVNTHKGAIFLLGTVCGAIGRLWKPDAPCRDAERIAQECAALSRPAIETDFSELQSRGAARTAGEKLFLNRRIRGARGELAAGLPSVMETGLPVLNAAFAAGYDRNDAGVYALLSLIARGEDTNMIKRGGADLAGKTATELRLLLQEACFPPMTVVEELDRRFISLNLSPGGCADLLAVCCFLNGWRHVPRHACG